VARVVLTQPHPRIEGIGLALGARGHDVLRLALSRLEPRTPDDLADRIRASHWVIAVSPAAVGFLFDALHDRWPGEAGLAMVGPGSKAALDTRHLIHAPSRVVTPAEPPWDAAALIAGEPFASPAGLRCLVIRGDSGREDWIDRLREQGAGVAVISAYHRLLLDPSPDLIERLHVWTSEPEPVAWVFTQASTITRCRELLGARFAGKVAGRHRALVVHPRIAAAAREAGFESVAIVQPGIESLAAALESG
jgi:uroporphyrinogen-III synthase